MNVVLISRDHRLGAILSMALSAPEQVTLLGSPTEVPDRRESEIDAVVLDLPAESRRDAYEELRQRYEGRVVVPVDDARDTSGWPPDAKRRFLVRPFQVADLIAGVQEQQETSVAERAARYRRRFRWNRHPATAFPLASMPPEPTAATPPSAAAAPAEPAADQPATDQPLAATPEPAPEEPAGAVVEEAAEVDDGPATVEFTMEEAEATADGAEPAAAGGEPQATTTGEPQATTDEAESAAAGGEPRATTGEPEATATGEPQATTGEAEPAAAGGEPEATPDEPEATATGEPQATTDKAEPAAAGGERQAATAGESEATGEATAEDGPEAAPEGRTDAEADRGTGEALAAAGAEDGGEAQASAAEDDGEAQGGVEEAHAAGGVEDAGAVRELDGALIAELEELVLAESRERGTAPAGKPDPSEGVPAQEGPAVPPLPVQAGVAMAEAVALQQWLEAEEVKRARQRRRLILANIVAGLVLLLVGVVIGRAISPEPAQPAGTPATPRQPAEVRTAPPPAACTAAMDNADQVISYLVAKIRDERLSKSIQEYGANARTCRTTGR